MSAPSLTSRATIVFDLDGTLAETAPDIFAVLNIILEREGLFDRAVALPPPERSALSANSI